MYAVASKEDKGEVAQEERKTPCSSNRALFLCSQL